MKRVAVLTTSRSDFGLQIGLIRVLAGGADYSVDVIVTGSHFLDSSGESLAEIWRELKEIPVNVVEFPLDDSASLMGDGFGFMQVQGLALGRMVADATEFFDTHTFDALVFLGDRWELWGFVFPAFLSGIPLVHISGGETTLGAVDDSIRHSLSKLSSVHLVAASVYGETLSRMGEEDWRIAVCGELGLDELHEGLFRERKDVLSDLGMATTEDYVLLTFHPATRESQDHLLTSLENLSHGLASFPELAVVMTAPNAEPGSDLISDWGRAHAAAKENFFYHESLGRGLYLEAMSHAALVFGNSSSGRVEAPSLGVWSLNVGSRQDGRLRADSVIDVAIEADKLRAGITKVLNTPRLGRGQISNPYDPYGDGKNAIRGGRALTRILENHSREDLVRKSLDFNVRVSDWVSL